jgi:hypothetical protein
MLRTRGTVNTVGAFVLGVIALQLFVAAAVCIVAAPFDSANWPTWLLGGVLCLVMGRGLIEPINKINKEVKSSRMRQDETPPPQEGSVIDGDEHEGRDGPAENVKTD